MFFPFIPEDAQSDQVMVPTVAVDGLPEMPFFAEAGAKVGRQSGLVGLRDDVAHTVQAQGTKWNSRLEESVISDYHRWLAPLLLLGPRWA